MRDNNQSSYYIRFIYVFANRYNYVAKAELLLTAAIDSLFVFFVYDVPIPEQYFFPAPGEGVGAKGFVECAVGIAVHFFLC